MFGGIGKILSNPMNLLAIATMNPAIIAATVARQLVSQIGQQVIQQLGEQLGLPQSAIDMAQGAFAASMGDKAGAVQNYREAAQGVQDTLSEFFDTVGASPTDRGRGERAVSDYRNNAESAINDMLRTLDRERAENGEGAPSTKAKGSILMQIAVALGRSMDDKMNEMASISGQIGDMGKIDGDNQSQYGELTGRMQGLGQELKLLSDALANTLKSIGEASSKLASKQ